MVEWTVIFDVDGVLLQLTPEEEEIFFTALSKYVPSNDLSPDWNSYRVRNDEDIIAEILERHEVPATMLPEVRSHYLALLERALEQGMHCPAIEGAANLLDTLKSEARLGIATANLTRAAALRLRKAGFWDAVAGLAQGADGGGHKSQILKRLLTRAQLPKGSVIFIGDNPNDVAAGIENGIHFIGYSTEKGRHPLLREKGAKTVLSNHSETLMEIRKLMA